MIKIKFLHRAVFLSFLFFALIFNSIASADDGDRYIDVIFSEGTSRDLLGTAIVRGKDIWVPADVLGMLGLPLTKGPNGKGFLIEVREPAKVFGIKELERLAGRSVSLYFPSMDNEGISYFNVKGLEKLTGIAADETNAGLELKRITLNTPLNIRKPDNAFLKNKRITLAWAHITRDNPDLGAEDRIDGLDVISPTWFNLTDGRGNMANRASAAYVEAAREKGYRIWPLVSNGFSKENTSRFFNDTAAVNTFIARILCYSKLYGFDGINIDFENVDAADRDKYVRFISLLSGYLKGQGLIS